MTQASRDDLMFASGYIEGRADEEEKKGQAVVAQILRRTAEYLRFTAKT